MWDAEYMRHCGYFNWAALKAAPPPHPIPEHVYRCPECHGKSATVWKVAEEKKAVSNLFPESSYEGGEDFILLSLPIALGSLPYFPPSSDPLLFPLTLYFLILTCMEQWQLKKLKLNLGPKL